jgi:trehalose/maltose transport system permease protein
VNRSPSVASLERRSAYLLVAPAVLILAAVALYPTLAAVFMSLNRMIIVFHDRRLVGLDNYAFMWSDARFWSALWNTVYFSFVAVAIELVLGMGFALLLDAPWKSPAGDDPGKSHPSGCSAAAPAGDVPSRGRALLRAAILIPWAIPTVVSAKMWAWLLNADYGLLVTAMPGPKIDWLGSPRLAIHAAILVDVWKTTPFVAFLLLAGLVTIPRDLYDAAQIDGASRLQTFVRVTLPLLKPTLAVTLIFRTLDAFRVFDAIYVLTEGGPANTTETLSVYAYKMLMRAGDFGYGSALSVATFGCVMALAAVYMKLLGSSAGVR